MQNKLRFKLINRRKEFKKTQQQVADEVEITRAFYTNIEKGEKDPSLGVAERIARVLNSTVDELFCTCEVPKRNSENAVNIDKKTATGTTG